MALRIFVVAPSALLTDHRPHGDGLVAFGFIRELACRGHELHVAAGHVALRDRLPENLRIHALVPAADGPVRARLRFMAGVRGLYRRLASEAGFDVVHQVTPVEVGVSLALAGTSAPVVLGPYVPDWIPGDDAATRQNPVAHRLKRSLRAAEQRYATTVLTSNPAAVEKVVVRSRRGLQVHELPLGVDTRTWHPSSGNGVGQEVLFLANLDTRKGVHVLLDAFARLAPELPQARLVVAGGGPEAAEVGRRARSAALLDRVELVGHLDRPRAVAAMQACDVYCLPAYGDPNPLSVLEAMACGKPVVATEAGGLGYVVPDQGGRKVAPGNPVALANALGEVLADSTLRHEMGAYNRRIIEERYAWARVVDRLEELYGQAIREA